MKHIPFILFCCLCIALSGCASAQPSSEPAAVEPSKAEAEPAAAEPTKEPAAEPAAKPTEVPPTDTPALTALTPTETPVPAVPALPAEPQRVEFEASDGVKLVGMYYPAAVNPAPVVVLMHWAGGDKNDWVYVGMAAWLQNRGLEVPAAPGQMPFDTPYPFEPLPEDTSFGVFLFDFRSYGESVISGEGNFSEMAAGWVLDAEAAYATARTLGGADPEKVAGIGASIGADAVADGCGELSAGALSLGPGGYLSVPYSEAVTVLDDLGTPVWCVAAEDDEAGLTTCNSAEGEHYFIQVYAEGGHAMTLFHAELNLDPLIEQVIVDFLGVAFGLE